jgi:hypothetical protein
MNMKIFENQQRIKKVLDSIQQARQNLELIQSAMPATAVVIRHRTTSTSSNNGLDNPHPQPQRSASIAAQHVETLATTNTPFSYDNGTTDYI